jgi:hypothetical protein
MAHVMGQSQGFGERSIQSQRASQDAGDLGNLKGVRKPAAGVIGFRAAPGEDLGLSGETAEGVGVQNAAGIANERRAVGMGQFSESTMGERTGLIAGNGNCRRKRD